MNKSIAILLSESLAAGVRLDVYRLLVRRGPVGMVAGEIRSALNVPPTNLSFHLKALTQASLVTVVREGRYQSYRAATGETCPAYLGPVLRTHWGVEDPGHLIGTEAEIVAAFRQAYRILRIRIDTFLALPLNELVHDRARLKAELDRIGLLVPQM